jgi:hypothetical protein
MKRSYRFSLLLAVLFVFAGVIGTANFDDRVLPGWKPAAAGQAAFPVGAALPATAWEDALYETFLPKISTGNLEEDQALAGLNALEADHGHSEGLHEFILAREGDTSQVLLGVYVEEVLALEVVQQPEGDNLYVDNAWGTATQFRSAADHGATGLLAHNYLSGDLFFRLDLGQEVSLIFGGGRMEEYVITDIQSYKKLPGDLRSSYYTNLDTGETVSTPDLFGRMYTGGDKVTFQTCIERGGDWSWGRIFITAERISALEEASQ